MSNRALGGVPSRGLAHRSNSRLPATAIENIEASLGIFAHAVAPQADRRGERLTTRATRPHALIHFNVRVGALPTLRTRRPDLRLANWRATCQVSRSSE